MEKPRRVNVIGEQRLTQIRSHVTPIISQEGLDQDVRAEIERLIRLIKSISEQQLEPQVFCQKAIDRCVPCFNHWIENPVSP